MKRNYQCYKSNNNYESFLNNAQINKKIDRYYMANQLKPFADYLYRHGITRYEDFSSLFKKYGFKSGDICCIIQEFLNCVKAQFPNLATIHINNRELRKANFSEKNIIINRIAHEHGTTFFNFLMNYVKLKCPNMKKSQDFFKALVEKTDAINQQSKSIPHVPDILNVEEPIANKDLEEQERKTNHTIIECHVVKKIIIMQ